MLKLPLALVACAALNWASAQALQHPLSCGQDHFHYYLRQQHPDLQAAFESTFEAARQYANAPSVSERSPLKINVVVHVVWKNTAENLPDSVIINQIQVLNEDFNRLNADTANLRPPFQPVAGNPEIQFELADIVRTQTDRLFSLDILGGKLLSELKSSAQGGSNARDPQRYLNIWVCKIQPTTLFGIPVGQVFGFAFPPADLSHWPAGSGAPKPEEDGVVIDYRMFGRNNPNPMPNPAGGAAISVRGRTPVHEVGHYLGLRHIWGDGGLLGANDCNQSDGVDDTPFANAQSNFDCAKTKNTCPKTEAFYGKDMPDLVENYMDYSSETCMNMFTRGQAALMRSVLEGPRKGLVASSGTHSPAPLADLSLAPNPASDGVALRFQMPQPAEAALRIFNLHGQVVAEQVLGLLPSGPQHILISIQHLPDGLYTAELRTASARWAGRLCKS